MTEGENKVTYCEFKYQFRAYPAYTIKINKNLKSTLLIITLKSGIVVYIFNNKVKTKKKNNK